MMETTETTSSSPSKSRRGDPYRRGETLRSKATYLLAIIFIYLFFTSSSSNYTSPDTDHHNGTSTINACQVDKLNFPFRTVMIDQATSYKMFLYGAGKDTIISDEAFNSNGKTTFEQHIQAIMDEQLKDRIPAETLILDIGANIGTHALHLASLGYIVHGFEPSPDNFNLLQCSATANQFTNLIVNNWGLSNEDSELCLKIDQKNRGYAQLNTESCPDEEKVVLKKLDDYIYNILDGKQIYMIKIDVEGHELQAFSGGLRMLANDPPKLIFAEISWAKDKKAFLDFL